MIYLSFTIQSTTYAVPVKYISESIQCSHITRIPRMPKFVLGVMNLRGKIVPVMDTRIRMGMKSKAEERIEFVEMLKEHEKEHVQWVETLENEVLSGKNISVQRDPSLCNFGKWYGPFIEELQRNSEKSGNVDNALLNILRSFEEPHKTIHKLADRAEELIEAGLRDDAVELVRKARENDLSKLKQLFKGLYDVIEGQQKRDIVVIIQMNDNLFGITVDAIDSTLNIDELKKAPVETELVQFMSIVNDHAVQVLNLDAFTEIANKAA